MRFITSSQGTERGIFLQPRIPHWAISLMNPRNAIENGLKYNSRR